MSDKLREAMRERIERNKGWLSRFGSDSPIANNEIRPITELLEQALAALSDPAPAEQICDTCAQGGKLHCSYEFAGQSFCPLRSAEHEKADPVAWVDNSTGAIDPTQNAYKLLAGTTGKTPLYAAPQPASAVVPAWAWRRAIFQLWDNAFHTETRGGHVKAVERLAKELAAAREGRDS